MSETRLKSNARSRAGRMILCERWSDQGEDFSAEQADAYADYTERLPAAISGQWARTSAWLS